MKEQMAGIASCRALGETKVGDVRQHTLSKLRIQAHLETPFKLWAIEAAMFRPEQLPGTCWLW